MTNYNDGKWHGWNGGECPVHPETMVEIRLCDRNYENGDMVDKAGDWFWDATGKEGIIAFRVAKEHREPREWWLVDSRFTTSVYQYEDTAKNVVDTIHSGLAEIIHVREVLE